jgi:hypothetical protein
MPLGYALDGKEEYTCLGGSVQGEHSISVIISDKGARFGGVARCGSQWCIECASFAKEGRIKRIGRWLDEVHTQENQDEGYQAYFITLTIPRSGDPYQQLDALQKGWKDLQGRVSYRLKKQGIKFDFVRGLDVTFKPDTKRQYHCHLHVIMVLRGPFDGGKKYRDFAHMVSYCWTDIQVKNKQGSRDIAQRIEPIEADNGISRYLVKFEGLANEIANFQGKDGKDWESRGFWGLVGDVYRGCENSLKCYRVFLDAVAGRRTISFSRQWPKVEQEEEGEEVESDIIEYAVSIGWYLLIKENSAIDLFLLCAFRCFLMGELDTLENVLKENQSQIVLSWFLNRYAPP